jgi:hypothetical protein
MVVVGGGTLNESANMNQSELCLNLMSTLTLLFVCF